jgi:hypothetical protein
MLYFQQGTHQFPHREQASTICVYADAQYELLQMTDCDENADISIRTITILKATRCMCQRLVSSTNNMD